MNLYLMTCVYLCYPLHTHLHMVNYFRYIRYKKKPLETHFRKANTFRCACLPACMPTYLETRNKTNTYRHISSSQHAHQSQFKLKKKFLTKRKKEKKKNKIIDENQGSSKKMMKNTHIHPYID